jgi:hypothetical protein
MIHTAAMLGTTLAATTRARGAGGAIFAVGIIIAIVGIVAFWRILTQAGYSPWWSLIAIVPVVSLIFLLVFAFQKWPVTQRAEAMGGPQMPGAPGYGGSPWGSPPAGGPPGADPGWGGGAPPPNPYGGYGGYGAPAPGGPAPRGGESGYGASSDPSAGGGSGSWGN